MSEQVKELAPFAHEENKQSYLFGFEDYLDERELTELWREMVFYWKNFSNSEYGEPADDVIDIIIRETGLRRPEPESALEEEIVSLVHSIGWQEESTRERNMEAGYDTDLDFPGLPLAVLKIGKGL